MKLHTTSDILYLYEEIARLRLQLGRVSADPSNSLRQGSWDMLGDVSLNDLQTQLDQAVDRIIAHNVATYELNMALAATPQ